MGTSRFCAVLFDLDGTLLDTVPDLACAVNRMLSEMSLPALTEDVVATFVGRGITKLVERSLLRVTGDAGQLQTAVQIFERCYGEESGRRSRPYPGVEAGLRRLAGVNMPMGVVTNKAARFTHDLIRAVGWEPYFKVIVSGDTLPVRKPDPLTVLHACGQLSVAPEQTLFIGDSRHDVAAARGAGCTVWCVPYGYNEGETVDALECDDIVPDLEVAVEKLLAPHAHGPV
jgi:phosphoglycolate phosphatase